MNSGPFQQLTQENAAALKWKPDGLAEKVMKSGESGFITQAEQGQEGRGGALVGGKDGPDKQGLSMGIQVGWVNISSNGHS